MEFRKLKRTYPYLYGIRGVYFIWHGTNADPEVYYKGKTVNYYDVDNTMWDEFKETHSDPDKFPEWCRKKSNEIKELINSL